jgi:PST family polysaccharide transporter
LSEILSSFKQKAISGTAWMFTGTVAQRGIGLIVHLILAYLLARSDFGAVALVSSVIAILRVFAELGISVALVQREEIDDSLVDSAMSATVATTSLIVVLLWFYSGAFARFFSIPVLSALFKIAAFSYICSGLFSLYRSLLLREMRYKVISGLRFAGSIIHGVTSVTLAYFGAGPYSIVWGQVASSIVVLIGGIYFTGYVPKSLGRISKMWELFRFGVWVSLNRVLGQAAGHFDKFVIGKLLDATTLGGYYLAQRLVMEFPGLFTGTIDQVMLPIYSKWQNEPQRIQDGYWKGLRYSALVVLPISGLLFVFAGPIVSVLLPDQWLSIVPIVRILSLFGAIHGMGGGIFGSVIYATGKPKVVTIVGIFRFLLLPTCIYLGSFWGVEGVAWGMVAFGVIGRLFNQFLLTVFIKFSYWRFFQTLFRPLAAAVGMVLFGLLVEIYLPGEEHFILLIITLAVSMILTFFLYCWFCFMFLPDDYRFLYNEFESRLGVLMSRIRFGADG